LLLHDLKNAIEDGETTLADALAVQAPAQPDTPATQPAPTSQGVRTADLANPQMKTDNAQTATTEPPTEAPKTEAPTETTQPELADLFGGKKESAADVEPADKGGKGMGESFVVIMLERAEAARDAEELAQVDTEFKSIPFNAAEKKQISAAIAKRKKELQ
jgi:hypothetical protein